MIGTAWSLLPPIVAIALALKTKEVYSSLFIGIILGAVQYCISMGTGFDGFLVHLTNHTVGEGDDAKAYGLIHCLSDPWNVGILVFLVVLGSIVSGFTSKVAGTEIGGWFGCFRPLGFQARTLEDWRTDCYHSARHSDIHR